MLCWNRSLWTASNRCLSVAWRWQSLFFKMRFSSSSWALRFWSSLTCFAVRTCPSSISTVEYCLIHLPRADWETPYSLQSWVWVFPFWWSETRDFLKSSSYKQALVVLGNFSVSSSKLLFFCLQVRSSDLKVRSNRPQPFQFYALQVLNKEQQVTRLSLKNAVVHQ